MVDFEFAESKYGRIFKVAGPCKPYFKLKLPSGRCRENVRIKDVRASQSRLGQTRGRNH